MLSDKLLVWLFFSLFSLLSSFLADSFFTVIAGFDLEHPVLTWKSTVFGMIGLFVFVTDPYVVAYLGYQNESKKKKSSILEFVFILPMMIGGFVYVIVRVALFVISLILLGFQMNGPNAWISILLILPGLIWILYGSNTLPKKVFPEFRKEEPRTHNAFGRKMILLYAFQCSFMYTFIVVSIGELLNHTHGNSNINSDDPYPLVMSIVYWLGIVLFFRLRFSDFEKSFARNRVELILHLVSYTLLVAGFLNIIKNYI